MAGFETRQATMRRLIEDDVLTGTRQYLVDAGEDKYQIVTAQRLDGTAELNAEQRKGTRRGTRWGTMAHVARIPSIVMGELMRRGILRDRPAFRRWLNDPDNRVFRVREGAV